MRQPVLLAGGLIGLAVAVGVARALLVWRGIDARAAAWQALARARGDLLYVAIGDSTAQGVGSRSLSSSYVGLLAEDLGRTHDGRSVRVVNLSVTGARVADVLREQVPALHHVLSDGTVPDLVTVTVGANDAGRTEPHEFRASLARLLDALPDGTLVADVPDFGGGPRLAKGRVLAAVVREELAARPTLLLAQLEAATRGMGWRNYAGDLFHPSDVGYRVYARAFLDAHRR